MSDSTIFGLIVTFGLFILGLIFKRSKPLFFIQIIWIWIMLCMNYGGVDYNVHLGIYNLANNNFEIFNSGLYIYLCYIARTFVISFFNLNIILNTIALFLIYKLISKNTKNVSLACAFLLVYPLIECVIQKRFFLASTFSIYGFDIFFKKEKNYKIKSFLFLMIGGLIHPATFTYFILYFLVYFDYKVIKKIILSIIIIAFLMIPILPKIASVFFPASKVQLYFYTLKIELFHAICWMILHLIFVFLFHLFHKKIIKNSDEMNEYEANIYKLNLLSLLFLPLYYYEPTFFRLYRTILLLNNIFVANKVLVEYKGKWTKNQFVFLASWCLYFICVYLMIYVFTGAGFNHIVVPEYDYNYFINWIVGVIGG